MLALPVQADTMEDDAGTIVVTGQRDAPYRIGSISSATRTDTPLLDTPQAVTVLSKERLDDQAILSVQEALRFVPGAVGAQGEGNRDQVVLRGNNSTADFFVDGVRDDAQVYRDFYNLDRLEILKGSNAMIFGRGGGGGVINRVTKTPQATRLLAGDVAVDSWGSWRVAGDLNEPLAAGINARLNGVYENAHNHRHFYGLERWAVNPTLAFDLGGRGTLVLGYEHIDDRRTTDRGVPSLGNAPIAGYRDTLFGDPALNKTGANGDALTLALDYKLADNISLRNRTRYANYDKFYQNVFASGAVVAGSVPMQAYREQFVRDNVFTQTDLLINFSTGALRHELLAGFELGDQRNDGQRINGFFSAVDNTTTANVPLAETLSIPAVYFRPRQGASARDNRSHATIAAAFVQDQLQIGEHVILLAGLRVDRFRLTVDNRISGLSFARTDTLWSPRLGLVVKPAASASLYASYSRSYLPQSGDQFTSLDVSLAALEPERFENLEVGGKWDIMPGLSLTAAAYRLERSNTRAPGAVAGTIELTGKQRSRGIELGLDGQILPWWQVQAGVAVQSARIVSTTSAAPAGRHVALVPDFQASLWQRFQIAKPLGLGVGILHQGASFTGISNTVRLPAYTRVDGALFVTVTKGVVAQLNVENIFNTSYFPTAHTDNNITTGTPRTARLTIRTTF
ncbi:TonB-dependent receptor [Sandarakinorhabdus oryzae]|uniref:TonB-dependent receptor n=1 Tax=Sandarakinorhabdus oryzae TaxID=2675220 RepID=UPI001F27B9E6|nr:TonB-dependent siderophore receptor [Sandarakinorhabdus oryzae]